MKTRSAIYKGKRKVYYYDLTSIKITKKLHKELESYKEKDETFEILIHALLNYWVEQNKGKEQEQEYEPSKTQINLSTKFYQTLKEYKDKEETWSRLLQALLDYWIEGHKQNE